MAIHTHHTSRHKHGCARVGAELQSRSLPLRERRRTAKGGEAAWHNLPTSLCSATGPRTRRREVYIHTRLVTQIKSAMPTMLGLVGRVGSCGVFPPVLDLGLSVGPTNTNTSICICICICICRTDVSHVAVLIHGRSRSLASSRPSPCSQPRTFGRFRQGRSAHPQKFPPAKSKRSRYRCRSYAARPGPRPRPAALRSLMAPFHACSPGILARHTSRLAHAVRAVTCYIVNAQLKDGRDPRRWRTCDSMGRRVELACGAELQRLASKEDALGAR